MKKHFPIQILISTLVLLFAYQGTLSLFSIKPSFAESNYVANQIRLQTMERSDSKLNVLLAGSSLTARLNAELIEGDFESLNLGIDGSNALFAIEIALSYGKLPATVLIELNTIYRDTNENDKVLITGLSSGTNWVSQYVASLRAESRPVTNIYSLLKTYKDNKSSSRVVWDDNLSVGLVRSYTFAQRQSVEYRKIDQLDRLIKLLLERDVKVVLLMLPDGKNSQAEGYLLADAMTAQYEVSFLDLKTPLNDKVIYTDGLHLNVPSAEYVSGVIHRSLER